MALSFRKSSARVLGALGAIALATTGLVVVRSPSTVSATPNTLDHFLCYSASAVTASSFTPPATVKIKNVLQPSLTTVGVGAINLHCNPTMKQVVNPTGQATTFPINNPNDHLLCWNVHGTSAPTVLSITNQFGTATMSAGTLAELCLPSWKSLTGPPNQTTSTPPGLDHFACYPLSPTSTTTGFTPPGSVGVSDEFSSAITTVTVGAAQLLCVPTTKVANGAVYSPSSATDQSLTCFSVTKTPMVTPVYDQNQFGQGPITIVSTSYLCLPSTVTIAPVLDHFLCYTVYRAVGFRVPRGVQVSNVISSPAVRPLIGPANLHCNPTVKQVATTTGVVTYPISRPHDHLLCWRALAKNATQTLTDTNQFGTATVSVGQLAELCLPSWKSLKGLPNMRPVSPPGLDHFACYPIALPAGSSFSIPPLVRVRDEFARALTTVKVGRAVMLCVPTTKIANGAVYRPASALDESLTCFTVSPTPLVRTVFDENQFRQGPVSLRLTAYLCLPSTI